MKNAYLIIAHNQPSLLQKLVNLLDSKDNDIYIHIDKKMKSRPILKTNNSNLYYVKQRDVRWGSYTQIEAELELLKMSVENKKYDYYHLISGQDLPIKTNKEINEFLLANYGKEFVSFDLNSKSEIIENRIKYYHFFQNKYKVMKKESDGNKLQKYFYKCLEKSSIFIQKIIKINNMKKYTNIEIKKGANWFSITDEFARYVVERIEQIEQLYKYSICGDEIFLQTLLYNSKFGNNVYNENICDEHDRCLRLIDWQRGNPYIWKSEDWEEIIKNKNLFARKFDENIDEDIVEKLYNYLKEKENEQ